MPPIILTLLNTNCKTYLLSDFSSRFQSSMTTFHYRIVRMHNIIPHFVYITRHEFHPHPDHPCTCKLIHKKVLLENYHGDIKYHMTLNTTYSVPWMMSKSTTKCHVSPQKHSPFGHLWKCWDMLITSGIIPNKVCVHKELCYLPRGSLGTVLGLVGNTVGNSLLNTQHVSGYCAPCRYTERRQDQHFSPMTDTCHDTWSTHLTSSVHAPYPHPSCILTYGHTSIHRTPKIPFLLCGDHAPCNC